jgi:hypothetical protein
MVSNCQFARHEMPCAARTSNEGDNTATDPNGRRGRQTIPEGAAAAVRLALLPDNGPSGGFFNASNPQPS